MDAKRWFNSKLVWIGLLQTLIGICGIVAEFLSIGTFSPEAFVLLVAGMATVWCVETVIV